MVLKLSDEVGQLRSDNQSLKANIGSIAGAALPCVLEPLSGRDVTSPLPKDIAVKSYKDVLSASCQEREGSAT
jgi:hypothetical protein